MATSTYGKYFTGATVTTGWTSTGENRWNYSGDTSDRLNAWNEMAKEMYNAIRITPDTDLTKFRGGIRFENSHGVPTHLYNAGDITFQFVVSDTGTQGLTNSYELVTSVWLNGFGEFEPFCEIPGPGVIDGIAKACYDYFPQYPNYFYIGRITFSGAVGTPAINPQYTFKDRSGKQLFAYSTSATVKPLLMASMGNSSYQWSSLTMGGALPKITFTMTVETGTITYNTKTVYFSNLNSNGSSFTLSVPTYYYVKPTFLKSFRDELYAEGHLPGGPTVTSDKCGNHQDFIPNNGWKVVNDLINSYTREGSLSGSYRKTLTLISSTSLTNTCTHRFSWMAAGYLFYANTATTQLITSESYDNFNTNSVTYKSIYPKAASISTTTYCYITLNDVDEGTNSYIQGNVLDRYLVPPTDLCLANNGYGDLKDVVDRTYAFNNFKALRSNGEWVNCTQTANNNVPRTDNPRIAIISLPQTSSSSFPSFVDGIVLFSTEDNRNTVTYHNNRFNTSVKYHLTGEISVIKYQTATAVASALISFNVKKNDLDFVNNSTLNYGFWEDSVDGLTYKQPMPYANKVSTFDDLLDKMTMFHGRAIYYYAGSSATYFPDVKNWLNTQLWTNLFAAVYSSWDQTTTPIRYRSVTFNSTVYSELDWPMRWYSYPTWNSPTQTSFTYYSGLIVKKPSTFSGYLGELMICGHVTESDWANAITTSKSYSGSYAIRFCDYNGLWKQTVTFGKPMPSVLTSNTNTTWNRDRRAIGNYENSSLFDYDWSGSYIFSPANRIYDWLRDTVSYFSMRTNSSHQRYIGYDNDTTKTVSYFDPFPVASFNQTDIVDVNITDRSHRVATNDILYTKYKPDEY